MESRIEDESRVATKNAETFKNTENQKAKIADLKSIIDKLLLGTIKGVSSDTIN
jgi:hypothetical protein